MLMSSTKTRPNRPTNENTLMKDATYSPGYFLTIIHCC